MSWRRSEQDAMRSARKINRQRWNNLDSAQRKDAERKKRRVLHMSPQEYEAYLDKRRAADKRPRPSEPI